MIICQFERERDLQEGDPAIQKAFPADSGWLAALSTKRNGSAGSIEDRGGAIQMGVNDSLLAIRHPRLAVEDRRPHSGGVHQWPDRTWLIFHWLQKNHAQAEESQGESSVMSLCLIWLCPNPKFGTLWFSVESGVLNTKKERHVQHRSLL